MTSANEGISVTINEHSIESVSAQKHMGITTDKNLIWEQQIDLVCRNVSRKLTLMKLLSKYKQNSLKQYTTHMFSQCSILDVSFGVIQ